MDRRVEAGFPKQMSKARPGWQRRLLQPAVALGMTGAAVLVIAVAAGGLSGSNDSDEFGSGGGGVAESSGGSEAGGGGGGGVPTGPRPRPPMASRSRRHGVRGRPRRRRGGAPALRPRLRPGPERPQDRALGGARARDARGPDVARGGAGDRGDQPPRRLRAQLLGVDRRGRRGRRLRPAHPVGQAAPGAARPRRPWPRCAPRARPAAT